jgi:uncharacterized delta-60 repeat protein
MRRSTAALLLTVLLTGHGMHARAGAGALDPTFSHDGIVTAFKTGSIANAVAADHAGRTVVVGQTTDDHVDVAVARFRPDGTPDLSFGGDGRVRLPLGADAAVAFDVAVAHDDGLAIVGRRTVGTTEDSYVLRLDAGGEPLGAFGADGLAVVNFGKQESANAVAFTDAGRIDIGGYVSNGTTQRCALARLNADGSLDPRLSGDGMRFLDISAGADQVNDLLAMPHGDIVATGPADTEGRPAFTIFRVHANGDLVPGFGTDGVTRTDLSPGADVANAITLTRSGAFAVVGSAGNGGHRDWGVVRYRDDGSLDPVFGAGGIRILSWTSFPDAADDVLATGRRLVVAGRIHHAGTGDDAGMVRLRAGGKLDKTFGDDGIVRVDVAGRTDAAHGLALQANGKVLLAGETWAAGSPRFLVARLRAG